MTAKIDESPTPSENDNDHQPENIIERIEKWIAEHPEATEYWIETETEAEQILLAMAAVIRLSAKGVGDRNAKRMMRDQANQYVQAVQNNAALELFRNMTEADQLELYEVRLRARSIALQ